MTNMGSSHSPETRFRSESGTPELRSSNLRNSNGSEQFMDLLFLGWNPDLPDPGTLNH